MSLLRPLAAPPRLGPAATVAVISAGAGLAAAQAAITLAAAPVSREWVVRIAYLLAVAVGLLFGHRLTPTWGGRGPYVWGTAAATLATAVAAVAAGRAPLLPVLLGQALAAGVVLTCSAALLGTVAPPASRAAIWWAGAVAVGAVIGALAGLGPWAVVCGIVAALGLALVIVARSRLVEPSRLSGDPVPRPLIAPPAASAPIRPDDQPLFFQLPEESQRRLAAGNRRAIPAGDWLVREGEAADSMFVISAGLAEVVVGEVAVRELGPGSVVGELGLLTGGTRSASVRARRDCDVIEVSREVWDAAVLTDPSAVGILVKALAGQLARTAPRDPLPIPVPSVIGVAAGDARAGSLATQVTAVLRDLLARHGRVEVLAVAEATALERAIRDHDWVLVCSDGSDPQWHDYVLRQCDRLVLVTESASAPHGLPREIAQRPELVLIGPRPASATFAAWTESLDPWRVTIAGERTLPADLRHLAARLAGRSVGLLLSGGGARAMTHIGVILELEEAGIEIDRIAGTSLGAIVGVVYASGADAAELAERGYAALVRGRPYGDFRLPVRALTRGGRHLRLLEDHVGDLLIEEMPRGFRCVSVDLVSRELRVHRSGPAAVSVTASSRLPIVFPPMPVGSQLLIDGGALDNMPIQLLTERDEGPVIAVNAMPDDHDYGRRWGLRADGTPTDPTLVDTLLRIVELNADEDIRTVAAGAYILTPSSMGIGTLDFHHFDRLVESGRLAARQLLDATGGDLHSPPHR